MTKTEYFKCKFTNITQETNLKVRLDSQVISKRESFKYIGSTVGQSKLSCPKDESSGDEDVRWMREHTRRDMARNEDIRDKVGVSTVVDKLRESSLRWFGHVKRRCPNPNKEV
nr:uncharacterized protein LOC104107520 [Nicotiana tomentosiformis]